MVVSRRAVLIALAALAACVSCALGLYITAQGAGISPDTTTYFAMARNALAGQGLSLRGHPVVFYAPLYPLLLAAGTALTGDMLVSARIIAVLGMMAITLLVGGAVWRATGSISATYAAMFVQLCSAPLLRVEALSLTEVPFIALGLAGLWLLAEHLARPAWPKLAGAALFGGLAVATRYAGLSLILAQVLALGVLSGRSWLRRLRDALVYGGALAVPLGAVVIRNALAGDASAGRQWVFHPVTPGVLQNGVSTVLDWTVLADVRPEAAWMVAGLVAGAVVGALLTGLVLDGAQHASPAQRMGWRLCAVLSLFCVVYAPFLVVSISYIDASTPLDWRMLAPAYAALVPLAIAAFWQLARIPHAGWLRGLGYLLAVMYGIAQASRAVPLAAEYHETGLGYAAKAWSASPTVLAARALPPGALIYTDLPDALSVLLGRDVNEMPSWYLPVARQENARFEADARAAGQTLAARGGYIVHFSARLHPYLASPEQVAAFVPLCLVQRATDGAIYQVRGPDGSQKCLDDPATRR